jgi:hypothetical protein
MRAPSLIAGVTFSNNKGKLIDLPRGYFGSSNIDISFRFPQKLVSYKRNGGEDFRLCRAS